MLSVDQLASTQTLNDHNFAQLYSISDLKILADSTKLPQLSFLGATSNRQATRHRARSTRRPSDMSASVTHTHTCASYIQYTCACGTASSADMYCTQYSQTHTHNQLHICTLYIYTALSAECVCACRHCRAPREYNPKKKKGVASCQDRTDDLPIMRRARWPTTPRKLCTEWSNFHIENPIEWRVKKHSKILTCKHHKDICT